jgi:hypothetical protein
MSLSITNLDGKFILKKKYFFYQTSYLKRESLKIEYFKKRNVSLRLVTEKPITALCQI